MHWLTIEVFDAETPASAWLRSWQDSLIETAITGGAVYWDDSQHAWGVVVEFTFGEEAVRDRFREHPTITASLDAAPNPTTGVLVYPHRGGGAGVLVARTPRPTLDSGAIALPI